MLTWHSSFWIEISLRLPSLILYCSGTVIFLFNILWWKEYMHVFMFYSSFPTLKIYMACNLSGRWTQFDNYLIKYLPGLHLFYFISCIIICSYLKLLIYLMNAKLFHSKQCFVKLVVGEEVPSFLFRDIAQMMEQFNFSINFFLYVICSKGFRRNLQQVSQK